MKNTKNVLRIIALVAVIGFSMATLSLTGCLIDTSNSGGDGAGNGSDGGGGGGNGGTGGGGGQTFTSVAALGTWLGNQPANTAATAYNVKLNVSDISGIQTTLRNNANKYVYLDLSGSTITSVGEKAFYYYCRNLTGIIIPDSVISIESGAFEGCTSLTSVTIPDSVTNYSVKIGVLAFNGYTSLTSVTFEGQITSDRFPNGEAFLGDLRSKFYASDSANGTPGTYITTAPVTSESEWTLLITP